jgi:hypothetical protein
LEWGSGVVGVFGEVKNFMGTGMLREIELNLGSTG